METLREARPTRFLGVPRVWEKLMEGIISKAKTIGGFRRKMVDVFQEAGIRHHLYRQNGIVYKYVLLQLIYLKSLYPTANFIAPYRYAQNGFYKRIKTSLGLERCTSFGCAAAPLPQEVALFFMGFDICLMDAYGMSEGTGGINLSYYI